LADPDAVDLGTFNREVWVVWSSVTLNGQDVTPLLAPEAKLSETQLQQLDAGLDSGGLELHGNCMWGTATRIFGPMVPGGDEDRLSFVRQALEILNDENLEPTAKAKQILEVPGFGHNIATGLVMVYHPDAFAIWNSPSGSAFCSCWTRAYCHSTPRNQPGGCAKARCTARNAVAGTSLRSRKPSTAG
jgi:5-methylcytosine-specific restriction enzyme B